jgi:hypothetical protein
MLAGAPHGRKRPSVKSLSAHLSTGGIIILLDPADSKLLLAEKQFLRDFDREDLDPTH